ncbi:MAG: ABC transporter ATP-binding protein [Bacteroides sp.]|nr:ABC transporter ATP-binding protein [Bacteroides sp.]MCM1548929.1 ABC transporter ATP-binding protein [Clostridium sp.]
MIEIQHVTKIYKLNRKQMEEQKVKVNKKVAVRDVSLTAREGEIFGILGPNGAGKTTLLRCVATLLRPTEGQITVNGFDTIKEGEQVRRSIAFLTNEVKLDAHFSPKYLFRFFGRLYGMKEEEIESRRKELFEYFGITNFEDKRIEELSTGMKQKASIAVSLVHNPDIVIFDEPTNGLDIITARAVTDYLKLLKEQGKLVVVSTHIMPEAQKLCDRMAMIINGSCVFQGTLEEALEQNQAQDLEDAFFEIYRQVMEVEA